MRNISEIRCTAPQEHVVEEIEEHGEANGNSVRRFEPKTEAALLRALTKLVNPAVEPISEEDAASRSFVGVMTSDNVAMVCAKTEHAKRMLSRYVESDGKNQNEVRLEFGTGIVASTKYSVDKLSRILGLFAVFGKASYDVREQNVLVTMAKDYPIKIENTNFAVVLAPYVGE